jgi:hypothetical protein
MVWREDGSRPVLTEVLADDEFQLQEIVKDTPDLLPVDEFGMTGPLMVVGRETSLPSGAVDLIGISRDGELLLIEFKTGPQNSDFRHVLAQLLDYGSDLWRMSYEEFESTVVKRFFSGDHCRDERLRGKASIMDAALEIWPDLSEEEIALLRERLSQQLDSGEFHYIVVAQRFRDTMERTVEYLNATMRGARFYAVELVRFSAGNLSAFESRTVLKPESRDSGSTQRTRTSETSRTRTNEVQFLERIEDDAYRETLRDLLDVCHGLGLQFSWGPAGTSIRMTSPDRPKPLSIAWLFPPGVSGWMGLTDLTLGHTDDQENLPQVVEDYVSRVSSLRGVEDAKPKWLNGYHLSPETTIQNHHQIVEILAELVSQSGEESQRVRVDTSIGRSLK